MKLRDLALRLAKPFLIEGPARERSLNELKLLFYQTTEPIEGRFYKSKTPQAEEIFRHIIGIERWGQRRLQVAFGAPLLEDVHHTYKPPEGLDKYQLLREFRNTRLQTIELTDKLKGTIMPQYIPHNDLGPLSTRGWLYYLYLHANFESRRMR